MKPVPLLYRFTAAALIPLQAIVCAPAALAQAPQAVAKSDRQFDELKDGYQVPWTPPAPVRTSPDLKPNGAKAAPSAARIGSNKLSASPDVEEIKNARILRAPLAVKNEEAVGATERSSLSEKLSTYAQSGGQFDPDNLSLLEEQLEAYPDSPLRPTLLLEKALLCRRNGHFMKAEGAFAEVWSTTRDRTDAEGRHLAEEALDGYIRLSAALGRTETLSALVTQLSSRNLGGAAAEALRKAKEALWFFKNRAEQNIFCGFSAANAVCVPLGERPIVPDVHNEEEKATFIRDGLSLYELAAHSHEAGGSLRVIKRTEGTAIPVPSVLHWKFSHYSAITEQDGDRFRVTDAHLDFDGWISRDILENQLSGYFLVPAGVETPAGFTSVPEAEAKKVFGRHCVHARDDEGDDCSKGGDSDDCAMTTYNFRLLKPGLVLRDTPISYAPAYGPAVGVQLRYDQRSTGDAIPDAPDYSNFGPRWTHSLISLAKRMGSDGVNSPNTKVRIVRGNGAYYDYNLTNGVYSTKSASRPQLSYVSGSAGTRGYRLIYPDGSQELFNQADGPTENRYFLKQSSDPQGNSLTFAYNGLRLLTITDALGQVTTFGYSGSDLKIRTVTDPYSRTASFDYDRSGRLRQITDAMNIVSEFRYGANDFVEQLTTPYGTTRFRAGELPGINAEPGFFIEAVDPAGDVERVEANDFAYPQYPDTLEYKMVDDETGNNRPPASVTVAGNAVPFLPKTQLMQFRNTFYWDKEQMAHHAGDYSKATIYNWLTVSGDTITGTLASMKKPLEGRVWFNYPGQQTEHSIGQSNQASKILRAVEKPDGTTAWAMQQVLFAQPEDADPNGISNPYGLPVGRIDAEGRRLRYRYAANGLDLEGVDVLDGATWRTLTSLSNYTTGHQPQTVTDASGLTTALVYNAKGQLTQSTVSKGGNSEVTKLTYDGTGNSGYLVKVEQTAPGGGFATTAEFTYDAAKRIRTAKDADGYTLTYDYDNFDRVTLITHPDTTTEQFVWEKLDLHAVKDRGGLWSRTFHNALRQPVVFQDPKGRVTALEWCRCGDIRKLIDPMNKVTWWKRDAQGRVYEKLLPDGASKTLYNYQPFSGRLDSMTLPNDVAGSQPTATYAYNLAGQILNEDYADSSTSDVSYLYNDYLARLSQHTDSLGSSSYTYQPIDGSSPGAGGLETISGPRANDTLSYGYDWQDRLTQRQLLADDSSVQRTESVQFDSLGRLDSLVSGLGTSDYIYNAGNIGPRVDAIAGPNNLRTDFSYFPVTATGGKALQLSGIANKWSTTALSSFSYDYDKSGRITTWGRVLDGVASTWSFEYSRASELTGGTLKNASQQVTKTMRYLYDGSGNRVLQGEDTSSEYARYNSLNQLNKIGGKGPALIEGTVDEPSTVTVNGQRTETVQVPGTSTYRFERQIDAKEGSNTVEIKATDARSNTRTDQWKFTVGPVQKTLNYDLNGNLLSDGIRTFTWDAKNRLISVVAGGVAYAWEYDGLDRRVREKRNGALAKEWFWDGLEMIQERDGSGAVTKTLYDNGETMSGANYYFTGDHLGNIREMVDSTGAVRVRYDYDLYGKQEKLSGDLDTDFGFTGHYWHAETGLYLAPYRAYDPELGRWISRDPLGEFAGSNLYSYVLSNPISLWDPDGRMPEWVANAVVDSEKYVRPGINALTGLGDALSFGASGLARRNLLGNDDGDLKCSKAYKGGELASLAFGGTGAGRLAYMGSAKLIARGAPATMNVARRAVSQRNTLKRVFRGGLFPNRRVPSFEQIASKPANSAKNIIDSARRTNSKYNRMGGAAATAGLGGTATNSAINGPCD